MRDRRPFSFADKLSVWPQQSAQEPGNANQTDEKRDDEAGKQRRSIDECGRRRQREDHKNQDRAYQKNSGEYC